MIPPQFARVFHDDATAIRCIGTEIAAALPEQWTAHRRIQKRYETLPEAELRLHHQEWKIAPPYEPGELPSRDYLLRLDAERRLIMIVHGNSDAGGCVLNWMLQRATLIHVQDLQYHPLREALRSIINTDNPNTWGLS